MTQVTAALMLLKSVSKTGKRIRELQLPCR